MYILFGLIVGAMYPLGLTGAASYKWLVQVILIFSTFAELSGTFTGVFV